MFDDFNNDGHFGCSGHSSLVYIIITILIVGLTIFAAIQMNQDMKKYNSSCCDDYKKEYSNKNCYYDYDEHEDYNDGGMHSGNYASRHTTYHAH